MSTSSNHTCAHVIRLGGHELLGDSRPDLDRPWQPLPLHELLYRERCSDLDGHSRVVTLTMAGRAFHYWEMAGHSRHLTGSWYVVDIRAERDLWAARTPSGDPRRRDPGYAFLDCEAIVTQQSDEVSRRLEFLKAELAKAEDLIDDVGRELPPALDRLSQLALPPIQLSGLGVGGARCTEGQ